MMRTAFVLGGGGHRGAYEVGMLKALVERGLTPDFVCGTSIGAINGALFASSPDAEGVAILERAWNDLDFRDLFPGSMWSRTRAAIEQRTYLHANDHLRGWLVDRLGAASFSSLSLPFACVAACIEDSTEVWFDSGPLIEPLLASSAVPGLLPPVEIGAKHYIDGGVVNSIPLSRAVASGASRIFVLHVGHIDDRLDVPTRPWDVGIVTFEIARRHRFASDLASIPDGVDVHILPTGATVGKYNDPMKLKYGDLSRAEANIESAYNATLLHLDHIPD